LFSVIANFILLAMLGVPSALHRVLRLVPNQTWDVNDLMRRQAVLVAPVLIAMALVHVLFSLRGWLKERAKESETWINLWMAALVNSTVVILGAMLSCAIVFSDSLYRVIPFSLGGGEPRQVVFWLGTGTGNSSSFLKRDGENPYSIPYQLLMESEGALVVVSPEEGQRAIELDRKAVGAFAVLGKRPKTALANFEQGNTEGKPAH
jgi:hypothetical protein